MLFTSITTAALLLTSVIAAPFSPNVEIKTLKARVEDPYWGMIRRDAQGNMLKARVEDPYWGMIKRDRTISLKPGCGQAVNIITCSYTADQISAAGVESSQLKDNCAAIADGIDCTYDLSTIKV